MIKSKKIGRETISSKKNKDPQDMSHDLSAQSAHKTTHSTVDPFSAQELREINIQISASWFKPPKTTQLTLMEVHPWRLHAYWNISADDMAAARKKLAADESEPPLILRFIDLSAQHSQRVANHRFDIEVHGLKNSWYVDLWQDKRRYLAQLGLRKADGEMILLASSNEVTLPRAAPSNELDFRQLEVCSPQPPTLNVPEITTANSDHLLKKLFPGNRLPQGEFPEFVPQNSAIKFEEPQSSTLIHAADSLTDRSLPFKPEVELIDHAHIVCSPVITENTEFPKIESSKIVPFSIQANKEKARVLDEIKVELPPLDKETISVVNADFTAEPLPLFSNNTELVDNALSSEPVLKSSTQITWTQTDNTDSSNTPAQLERANLLQRGFPVVMQDTDVSASELPVAINNIQVTKTTEPTHAPQIDNEEIKPETFTAQPAPRPVIALEEILSNSFFSYSDSEPALKVNAELHLHGKLESDSVLSLLGEQVQVDEHGNFSVKLKLDKSPTLSTFLYGQRKWNKGPH